MKRFLVIIFILAGYSFILKKPNNLSTKNYSLDNDSIFKKSSVLVIPFESKMYMSQIDKQLAQRSGLSYAQLVQEMRKMLVEIVALKVDETMKSYRLFAPGIDSIEKELHYAYTSINYNYRPIPEGIQKDPVKKDSSKLKLPPVLNNKKEKQKENNEGGTRIVNGQIVSEESNVEKFMDVDLLNDKLLQELSRFYNSKWFIFLNQLDLLYSSESPAQIRIKVHYSIFDGNQNKKYAGAAVTMMPEHINDLKEIKNDYFFKIATEINNQFSRQIKLLQNSK